MVFSFTQGVSPVLLSELLPFKSSCSLTVVVFLLEEICLILVHTCLFVTIVLFLN